MSDRNIPSKERLTLSSISERKVEFYFDEDRELVIVIDGDDAILDIDRVQELRTWLAPETTPKSTAVAVSVASVLAHEEDKARRNGSEICISHGNLEKWPLDALMAFNLACDRLRAKDAAETPVAHDWVSVSERLPVSGLKVLGHWKNELDRVRRTCVEYIAPRTVTTENFSDDTPDDWFDCDESGTSWVPSGWYELPETVDDRTFVSIPITHWMLLPDSPLKAQVTHSFDANGSPV